MTYSQHPKGWGILKKMEQQTLKQLEKENEAQIQFYSGRNGWAFDEIQKILNKKAKGDLSIDLDIRYKIFNQIHNDSVKAREFCGHIEILIKKLKKEVRNSSQP